MWLRIKITAAFAALLALPLAAGFVSLWLAGHLVLRSGANNDLNADTAAAAQSIEDRLALTLADLKAWAAMPVMQDVLLADGGGEIKRVVTELRRVYPEFAEIIVTDARGLVIASTGDAPQSGDLSSEESFRAATTGRAYQSASSGSLTAPPTLSFTVPVLAGYDRQSVVGTMTGVLDLKALIKSAVATTRFAGKGRSLVVEQNGVLIHASRASSGLIQALRSAGNYRARGVHDVSWNDRSYLAASVPTSGARLLSDPKMVVVGIVPTATAFAAVDRLSTIVSSVVVVALLVVSFFAWRWTTPLIQVSAAMERLSHGDTTAMTPDIAWERTFGPMARALETFRQTRIVRDKLGAREKEIERAKDAAETALKAKSEHLASLAGALKAELTTIVELSELINREALKEAAAGGGLARINTLKEISRSGVQLLGVINDLFDLSEAEAGHVALDESEADLGELVHECVGLMREAADKGRIDLVCQPPDAGVVARVDVHKIKQIMFNLLSNAVKFTREGHILVGLAAAADEISIRIADTGCGIARDEQERVFAPFYQAASFLNRGHGGTGLGLTLSRRLAHRMGGTIDLDSVPGKGSTFTLRLPRHFTAPAGGPQS